MLAALAQMVACLPLIQQVQGSIPGGVVNFNFFLMCELPLILGVGGNLKKKARDIYERTPDTDFERDWSIGLGSTFGDGQTHTGIFSKTVF